MKNRLPIKGWQLRELMERTPLNSKIHIAGKAGQLAFHRAGRRLGFEVGTKAEIKGKQFIGWIISKKGKWKC